MSTMVRQPVRWLVSVFLVGCFATAAGIRGADQPLTLGVTGRANAHVSLASSGSFVAAVWSASAASGATDIYAAVSVDGGARFSAPARVNQQAGEANVNGEQPPRVTLVARERSLQLKLGPATSSKVGPSATAPAIVVVWTAKGPAGTRMLTARSIDSGRTFSRAAPVPGSEAAGNRGWEAVASDSRGRAITVWLDHRGLATPGDRTAATHHETSHSSSGAAKRDGVATAQLSKLYFSAIDDPSSTRAITGGVCYCCKTALAAGPADAIGIAWRHVYPGNIRDIAFTISRDAGKTFAPPIRVSEDKWELEGCPDDGPAMAVDAKGVVHVVWPTLVTEKGSQTIALFHALSVDGRRFSARQRIPTQGVPHHPQVALARDGSLVVAWDESGNGSRQIAAARGIVDAGGRTSFRREALSGGERATYPVLAASDNGVLVAFTAGDPSSSTIRLARLR
jgi:hypothetical protein